jgi:hypothetical protein
MRLRPRCVVVVMLLLVPTSAQAHLHRWDVAAGAASEDGSRLWGGRFSIGLTNRPDPLSKEYKRLSWLIDVTNLKDREPTEDTTLLSYFVGPRYAIGGRDEQVLMLHGQVGIIDKHQGATGQTDLGFIAGAAYEFVWGDPRHGKALRIQAEHSFVPDENVKGHTRYSVAFVKRFE